MLSINSKLKAIYIIGQRKAIGMHRIPEPSCTHRIPKSSSARKETATQTSLKHLEIVRKNK